ncbi:MAG: protein kinase domain-containing protein [Candidatus Eiseniibacteriota bacterium]
MNEERWRRLRELFARVQEMPEAERAAFVDREAAGDAEIRERLEVLLAAGAGAGPFLSSRRADELGSTVGPYRLLEKLGEGGFGVVYLAEQLRPIQRRVALKLIKPGMDTRQVIARFEAERQALARMDHPGIAQVFEAGETDRGHPYFVMEYVPGVPITAFCDGERLRIRRRLELFLSVCDAVQHAHQRGVIHRDLKPSNVLVARRDGTAGAKVIDFGILKATTGAEDEATAMTQQGLILGTLGYMSPEQIGAVEAVVDVRSDIYSLGVLLYEMLAGVLPFDRARLRRASRTEAARVIREEDPPLLSARVAATESAEQVAGARAVDRRTLLRELRGELEWITQRALERDPERRYASASELAADVRRHQANEPVAAGPPSTFYVVRKFARRHRAGVLAAALVLGAIVAGGISTGIALSRAVRAERTAHREAESARRVADFLAELFRTASPSRSRGETVTARTLLDQGSRRIRASLHEDPHVRARLLGALGQAHLSLGLVDEGLALSREALATSESAQPPERMETAERLIDLAAGLRLAGQPAEIEALLERAVLAARTSGGEASPLLARCLWVKGAWLVDRGDEAAADSLVTEGIRLCEGSTDPDVNVFLRLHRLKATIAFRRYDLETAERHYLRALELSGTEGADPPDAIHRHLASLYSALEDRAKAVHHAEEAVRLARQVYPPEHPFLADALSAHADALASRGEHEQAAAAREEAIAILRAAGPQQMLAAELSRAAVTYLQSGDPERAMRRSEEAWAAYHELYGAENVRTAQEATNLARWYADGGQKQRADSTFRAALPVLDRLDPQGFFTAYAYMGHANVARDLGQHARADDLYRHAEANLDSADVGVRPYFAECRVDCAYLRSLQGRHAEADSLLREAVGLLSEDGLDGDCWAFVTWAAARAQAGDDDGAVEKLREAARCGATPGDVGKYPELARLRSVAGYPFDSSS